MMSALLYGLPIAGFGSLAAAGLFLYWLMRLPADEQAAQMMDDVRVLQKAFLVKMGIAALVVGLSLAAIMGILAARGVVHRQLPLAVLCGWSLTGLCGFFGVLVGPVTAPRAYFAIQANSARSRRITALPGTVIMLCVIGLMLLELFVWLVFIGRAVDGADIARRYGWLVKAPGGTGFAEVAIARFRLTEITAILVACGTGSVACLLFFRVTSGVYVDAIRAASGHIRKKVKGLQDGDVRNPLMAAESLARHIGGIGLPGIRAYAFMSLGLRLSLALAVAQPFVGAEGGAAARAQSFPGAMGPLWIGIGMTIVPLAQFLSLGIEKSVAVPSFRVRSLFIDGIGCVVLVVIAGMLAWHDVIAWSSFLSFSWGIVGIISIVYLEMMSGQHAGGMQDEHAGGRERLSELLTHIMPGVFIVLTILAGYLISGGANNPPGGWCGIGYTALGIVLGRCVGLSHIPCGALPLWVAPQRGYVHPAETRRRLSLFAALADAREAAQRNADRYAAVGCSVALVGAAFEQARFWLWRMAGPVPLKTGTVTWYAAYPDGVIPSPDDILIALSGIRDMARAFDISPFNPMLLCGAVVGAVASSSVSSLLARTMHFSSGAAVDAARAMFRAHPGIAKRTERPDYRQAVVAALSALWGREMIVVAVMLTAAGLWIAFAGLAAALGLLIGCSMTCIARERANVACGVIALFAGVLVIAGAGMMMKLSAFGARLPDLIR